MAISDAVHDIKVRATRMYALAVMVETFGSPSERKKFVLGMVECRAISEQAADLLIEAFGLEAA